MNAVFVRSVLACVVVGAAVLSAAATAHAQESPAEHLFREGRALMLEGKFDDACPKIAESQRLEPRVGTMLNLAVCLERQGKLARAYDAYQRALVAARAENQPDRARLADQRITILEPRLPWLRVTTPADRPDLVVFVDGEELEPAAIGVPRPVDPGAHVILARSAGRIAFEDRLEIREGERLSTSVVPTLQPPVPDSPGAPERASTPATSPTPRAPRPPRTGLYRRGFLVEAALDGGFVTARFGAPEVTTPGGIAARHLASGILLSCNTRRGPEPVTPCDVLREGRNAAAFGLGLVARYAFHDRIAAGLRAHLGVTTDAGHLVAVGPSVGVAVTRWLELGAWFGTGSTSYQGSATVVASPGIEIVGGARQPARGSLGAVLDVWGAGGEVTVVVPAAGSGRLTIGLAPFFLQGDRGQAYVLPLSVGVRFD